jgi:hypothetical protein
MTDGQVGQSVLVSGSHLEPMTRFRSHNCGFFNVRCPLWWEDGSVIYLYNCLWDLPEQSLLGPSPTELVTIFISIRNRMAQLYFGSLGSLFIASYNSQGYGRGILTASTCVGPNTVLYFSVVCKRVLKFYLNCRKTL